MADSRAQAYADQLLALTRQAEAISPEARMRILKLLAEANRQILADLAAVSSGSYSAARLQMLKAQVERAMETFSAQAAAEASKQQATVYRATALQIDATVAAGAGRVIVHPVIDEHALKVVQGYTADLITGLSRDASAKINAAIQRGFVGQANLQQTVKQVGHALDGNFTGIFSEVGNRATMIATNEAMRVQSLASISRINALAATHPELAKRWLHIPVARVPRPGHLLADGQVRKPDEPFLVEGEELMYPRDPSGSPDNTINCHCLVQPYLSEENLKPTDQERQMLKRHGILVSNQAA